MTHFHYDLALAQAPSVTFDRSDLALTAAINHVGIAMGRKRLITNYLKTGQLITPFPTLEKACLQRYYIVTPYCHNQKINVFVDWLRRN